MLKNCRKSLLVVVLLFVTIVTFAQTGVKGCVVDRRGKPVALLPVWVVQQTDTLQTLTAINGNFLVDCQPGQVTVIIQNEDSPLIRFVTISASERVDMGNIKLNYTNIEVVIKDGTEENGMEPLEHIDIQKLATGAGGVEQFLKYTQAANSNNELTSNYTVRGGNYDENLVYVNGFLINRPFLTRSGQQEGMSFINTALVDNIYFSAGGFQSVYGDKLSSVLDIKYKKATTFHASAMASLLGVETHIEDALGKADRFRYLIGARYRANGYLLNSLPTKGNYNPVFWDVQFVSEYDLNENWKWKVIAHTASNEYQFAPQTQKTDFGTSNEAYSFNIYFDGQEDTRFITSTVGTALSYESKRFDAHTYFTAFHSDEQERFDIQGQYYINELETDPSKEEYGDSIAVVGVGTFMNHARNKLNATIFSVYHQATYRFNTPENSSLKNELNWGFGAQFDDFSDQLSEWRMIDSAGYSIPQGTDNDLALFEVIKGNLSLQNQRYHAYVQQHVEWKNVKTAIPLHHVVYVKDSMGIVTDSLTVDTLIGRAIGKWQLDVGVRALYTTYNKEGLVMPRASLVYNPIRYVFHDGRFIRRSMKLKIATGFYHQPPFYREFRTFNGTLNPEVRAQKSFHFVLGGDYSFYMWQRPKPFKFGVEAYYKYLWDINPYEIENVRIRYYAKNCATGYATGMDLSLNGEFVPGLLSFFKVGLLSTKENIIGDSYTNYYNAAGEKIIYGISDDQVAVDSVVVSPGGIRRPTDQHLTIGVLFQDNMPGLERFSVQMGLNYGSRLPYGPPSYNRYADTLTMKSYFRVDIGLSYDLLANKQRIASKWYGKMQGAILSFEVFNLLGINNVLSKQWVQDVSGKYYSIPNYLTQRRFNLKLIVRI